MIAIVGPGAVGGLLAALLHRSGEEVIAVARPATAERLARDGIAVRSDRFGDVHAAVPTGTTVPAGARVILTVKAYGLSDVLPDLRAADPAETLALLNGTAHAPTIAQLPGRTAAGSVTVEALRTDGVIRHRGDFLIVTLPDDADLTLATALSDAGVTVRRGGTEAEVLWAKYRFLAASALLTSWARDAVGPAMTADLAVTDGVVAEIAALATADGVPTTPEHLAGILAKLPTTMRTSLQADLEAGRPSELEHLGGHLLTLGERHGVRVPTLTRVVEELRARG